MKNYKLSNEELNLVDRIATATGMDCWLQTTADGEFVDLEKNRPMSARTAMRDLIDGLDTTTLLDLSKAELAMLVKIMGKTLK